MTELFRMPAAQGNGIEMIRYQNECFINMGVFQDPAKCLEYSANFRYEPGDILVCGYPKTGNHWMGNMVWKLKDLTDQNRPEFTVLALGETKYYDMQDHPRIIQSHLKPSRLPKEHFKKGGKIVLILRNPKDACVSFYHHLKTAELFLSPQTFEEYFKSFMDGDVQYSSYFDYVQEWEQILYDKANEVSSINVEVFYYEDCKKEPMENLERLNKFLGFDRKPEHLQKVLELTKFETMKTENVDKKKDNVFSCDVKGKSVIYRRGEIGDWKNTFTVTQSEIIDRKMTETLTKGMLKFTDL